MGGSGIDRQRDGGKRTIGDEKDGTEREGAKEADEGSGRGGGEEGGSSCEWLATGEAAGEGGTRREDEDGDSGLGGEKAEREEG